MSAGGFASGAGQSLWARDGTGTAIASGFDSTTPPLICCWVKIASATTLIANQAAVRVATANGNPLIAMMVGVPTTDPVSRVLVNAATAGTAATISRDAWHFIACQYGPWDNTSRSKRIWLDGALTTGANSTLSTTGTFDTLILGAASTDGTSTPLRGRLAEVAIYKSLSDANRDSLITALQTLQANHATCLGYGTPIFYRTLKTGTTDANDIGTFTITNVGSVTFDGADHPVLTGPSAAAVPRRIMLIG